MLCSLCIIVTICLECTVRIVKQTRPDALSWEGGVSRSTGSVTYSPSASRDALTRVASTCG